MIMNPYTTRLENIFSGHTKIVKFIFVLLHFIQWQPHSMRFCLFILYISTTRKVLFKFYVLNFAVNNQDENNEIRQAGLGMFKVYKKSKRFKK